jgi:hypothetical protein
VRQHDSVLSLLFVCIFLARIHAHQVRFTHITDVVFKSFLRIDIDDRIVIQRQLSSLFHGQNSNIWLKTFAFGYSSLLFRHSSSAKYICIQKHQRKPFSFCFRGPLCASLYRSRRYSFRCLGLKDHGLIVYVEGSRRRHCRLFNDCR